MRRKRGEHGRPYEVTEKDRQLVRIMAAGGIEHLRICTVLEVAPKTLRRHFRRELDTAADTANAMVVANLYKIATGASPQAIRAIELWTFARMGWRAPPAGGGELVTGEREVVFRWAEPEQLTVDAELVAAEDVPAAIVGQGEQPDAQPTA